MTDHKASNRYLDQLREQARLKQLGVKEQKKQQQSGLLSLLDLIDTNTKDAKKWMNRCLTPTNEKQRSSKNGLTMDQHESIIYMFRIAFATQH